MTALRFVSYGGGVQSTALLVLAAQGRIDFPTFVMANVGEDSENPATLAYVRDVATPYADAHGIAVHVVDKTRRDGTVNTLYDTVMREGSRSLPLPFFPPNGGPGNRSCTKDFKVTVLEKWAKAHGASNTDPATVAVGISLDEVQRANTRHAMAWERIVYPLVSMGEDTGLHLTRNDCRALIADAGLPVPPKSSCYFCPFHTPRAWEDMARDDPDLFAKSVDMERTVNERRAQLGRHPLYLTRFGMPLDRAVSAHALLPLFDVSEDLTDGECDNGACWT